MRSLTIVVVLALALAAHAQTSHAARHTIRLDTKGSEPEIHFKRLARSVGRARQKVKTAQPLMSHGILTEKSEGSAKIHRLPWRSSRPVTRIGRPCLWASTAAR